MDDKFKVSVLCVGVEKDQVYCDFRANKFPVPVLSLNEANSCARMMQEAPEMLKALKKIKYLLLSVNGYTPNEILGIVLGAINKVDLPQELSIEYQYHSTDIQRTLMMDAAHEAVKKQNEIVEEFLTTKGLTIEEARPRMKGDYSINGVNVISLDGVPFLEMTAIEFVDNKFTFKYKKLWEKTKNI